MRLLIGGMFRSGSTFSFNIARELLLSLGDVVLTATADSFDYMRPESGDVHLIIKSHTPAENVTQGIMSGDVKCICTIRKPEDSVASFKHAFGFDLERLIVEISSWLSWYSRVRSKVLTIDHQLIDEFPKPAVRLIETYLINGGNPDRAAMLTDKYKKSALKEKLDRLQEDAGTTNIGFSYYDNETFFHRRHISSVVSQSASQVFSAAEISQIRRALAGFVDSWGNLKPAAEWQRSSGS